MEPKPVLIEGDVARRVEGWLRPFRKKVTTDCARVPFGFRIRLVAGQVQGEVTAHEGDYICRNTNGGWYPVPAHAFERMYEEVPDGLDR